MSAAITPTQSNIQAAIAAFVSAALPHPYGGEPLAVFTGTVVETVLTVTKILIGSIAINAPLLGVAAGTSILEQLSGANGGIGTYQLSSSQTVKNALTMATGGSVVAGQQNRVSEPVNPFHVVFWPLSFHRLSTNVDASQDVKFVGSIADDIMTVESVETGEIIVGATVFGAGVTPVTKIVALIDGNGGTGTYQVSRSQDVATGTLSAGWKSLTENAMVTVQLDFHSSDTTAGDFAQTISIMLRDEYGVDFFGELPAPLNGVIPLYADDPVQRPFINAENAYEWRWSLDMCLEVNQTVLVPQTYADSADITVNAVSTIFPVE